MAVQKKKGTTSPKKAKSAKVLEKSFMDALINLEALSKDYLGQAKDKMKVGRKLADQIRKVADNVENELIIEGMNLTEAYDSSDFVGVGIGVL